MRGRTSLAIALATAIFSLVAAGLQLVVRGPASDLAWPVGTRGALPRSTAYASAPKGSRSWPDRATPVPAAPGGR